MKKEYILGILSLAVLCLGITCCLSALLLNSISISSKSVLATFGVCFIVIGIVSYIQHNKKYTKIKELKNADVPVMARWSFAPSKSNCIKEALYNKKNAAFSTAVLTVILFLVIAACFYFSSEKHGLIVALFIVTLSVLAAPSLFISILYYYDKLLSSPAEVTIGEDCIYFIDELHALQKSIYFLHNVKMVCGYENILQFQYGDTDLLENPVYTIDIPIPEGQLKTALTIQKHYLELIELIKNQ